MKLTQVVTKCKISIDKSIGSLQEKKKRKEKL